MMVQWNDALFGGDEELTCILEIELNDIRVKVLGHAVREIPGGTG